MKELELKKPITAHGETLSVLEFDEPTGKDVRELGYLASPKPTFMKMKK